MTTLVTGATGVVGPPLVRALLERGDELRILVRPDSEVEVLPDVDMDILDGDVTDRGDVMEAVKGCERVFHLAGLFKDTVENESAFFDVNVGGTVNILQAALDHGIQKVVVVSSASTVGEGRGETGTEDTEHRGYFLSPYERSKWESEQFVAEFVEKGVPAVIVNPSLVYGPGDSEHNGGRLTGLLNGVITASVDAPAAYVYVDDLISGFLKMMEMPDDFPGPVNLGNPDEFTIRELAEQVVELVGSSSKIVQARPLPEDDPLQRQPDITLAREKLGWTPAVPLREGLARTVEWFRSVDLGTFRAPTPNY